MSEETSHDQRSASDLKTLSINNLTQLYVKILDIQKKLSTLEKAVSVIHQNGVVLQKLTKTLTSLKESLQQPDRNHSHIKCYTCGQPGHLKRDCSATKCTRCRQYGHSSRFCTAPSPPKPCKECEEDHWHFDSPCFYPQGEKSKICHVHYE